MAALCTGISYGLSQSCLSNENKELIFVKLTDSAYRAIEEYQKNQVSTSHHRNIYISFVGFDIFISVFYWDDFFPKVFFIMNAIAESCASM